MVWTIGKRITAGFVIILAMLAVTTVMSYFEIGHIANLSKMSTDGLRTKSFLIEKEIDHIDWLNSLSNSLLNLTDITVQLDHHKCGFGTWLYTQLDEQALPESVLNVLKEIEPIHHGLHDSAVRIKKEFVLYDTKMDKELDSIWMSHLTWMNLMTQSIISKTAFTGQTDPHKCGFGKWYDNFKTDDPNLRESVDKWVEPHKKMHLAAAKIVSHQRSSQHEQALQLFKSDISTNFQRIGAAHKKTEAYLGELSSRSNKANKIFQQDSSPIAIKLRAKLHQLIEELDESLIAKVGNAVKDIAGTASFAKIFMLAFGLIATIIGMILAFFTTRAIVRPVLQISDSLDTISSNVGSASVQLSDASQELSSMSSEQASSVEETSSSLEEIEGMVQNNIANAEESVSLSNKVKGIADDGSVLMDNLANAMNDILDSNNKIEQLVKVIGDIGEKTKVMDEIVFQTKLLSFNASVEAERAGEHGRGFAVVAQEVGNLAQMSGTSAAEIATIVRESVQGAQQITAENKTRVQAGGVLVQKMSNSLKEIVEGASSVSQGASGVLAASTDQGKGIKQINAAMTEIDKVTQETAATAEQTASSSEELAAQVDSLRDIVKELTLLVIGKTHSNSETVKSEDRLPQNEIKNDSHPVSSNSDGWDEL